MDIRRIDWEALRAQKRWLIGLAMQQGCPEEVDGLLNLLDSIQDEAEDADIPPALIYGAEAVIPDECRAGLHSWIDSPVALPADHRCTHCGEAYGEIA